MRHAFTFVFALSFAVGCSQAAVDIVAEPRGAGGSSSAAPSAGTGSQGNGTSSGSSGTAGGAPATALRVNTPETDPGQYTIVESLELDKAGPPVKVADGPFMVTDFASQQGGSLFAATGTTCPANADPFSSFELGHGMRHPVLPGQVLCAAYGSYSDPPNGASYVSVTGYRPYAP